MQVSKTLRTGSVTSAACHTKQEEALEWNNLRAEYNQRLFSLFSLANEFNTKMKFTEETVTFEVEFREDFVLPSVLSETRDNNAIYVLMDLECEFEKLQYDRDAEKRRYALEEAALAKLNVEERELLGL